MKNYFGKFAALRRFIKGEEGLVTVEWVALTAGMVVAAVVIGFLVMDATAIQAETAVSNVGTTVTSVYGANGANLGTD